MTATQPATRHTLRVYGTPIPQGSKLPNKFGGGVRDANAARLKPWRDHVTGHARDAWTYRDTITDPVRVWLRFSIERPKTHYRTGRYAHLLKPTAPAWPVGRQHGDGDKLTRAVLDSLTVAGVWADDSLVVRHDAWKVWAGEHELALDRAGVDIIIEPLGSHP